MSYQLYGGTNKNIRDGNKEVSQFYDKGGNNATVIRRFSRTVYGRRFI